MHLPNVAFALKYSSLIPLLKIPNQDKVYQTWFQAGLSAASGSLVQLELLFRGKFEGSSSPRL